MMGRRKPRRVNEKNGTRGISADKGSITAGRDVKNATSFHTHNTVLPPGALKPVRKVRAPASLSNVSRSHDFVGRGHQLRALDAAFSRSGEVVVIALHGLGGVGKSTLAAQWARTRSQSFPQWWITADSTAAIDGGLADFAVALQPLLKSAGMGADDLSEWALQWLAAHRNWLIVLDNVNDPEHIRTVVERAGDGGRFLITSRRATGWHQLSSTIALDVLEEAEAVELFTRVLTHQSERNGDGMAEVCREVGHLPLAVEQSAAYCAETGISPRAYLDLLSSRPAEIFSTTAEGGDADRTIARIWSITLDHLSDTPLAGEVLRVLAWYAPDNIPRSLLDDLAYPAPIRYKIRRLNIPPVEKAWAIRRRIHDWGRSVLTKYAEPLALNQAIGRLTAYSMIAERDGAITVHRLVQALARTPAWDAPHRRAKDITNAQRIAAEALRHSLPAEVSDPETWPSWRTLLPHVTAHADSTPPEMETVTTADLLRSISQFLGDQGAIARSTSTGIRAARIHERLLGDKNRSTFVSRSNLARAYLRAGDSTRAIPTLERTLVDCKRVLGADHSETLASRSTLASAYQEAGDLTLAISLFEGTLVDYERVLGTDHLGTMTTRNNLANAYRAAGDLKRAAPLQERAYADCERVLGAEHPNTLGARSNLAAVYRDAGDFRRAISLLKRLLADCERVLGTDHPNTLNTRSNFANAYRAAGDFERAVSLFERAFNDCERVLGMDHPDTLGARSNLATAYQDVGDFRRAIPLFERTLSDAERVLGADHPNTLIARVNLDRAYQAADPSAG